MSQQPGACLRLENKHSGEVLELRRGRHNGQAILELKGTMPPHREGPPMHIHYLEDEEAAVISGTLSAEVGGRRIDTGPGETALLPRGVPHRWWNEGDTMLALAGRVVPLVDLDRYLQAVFEVINRSPKDRPSLFYIAHAALRHRQTQAVLIMPPPIQAVLFRVVVAVGTMLGRYRGEDWPGCPARCTGVPVTED